MSNPPPDGRPVWSAATAAKRCRVSRTTIQRALKQGRIPGAVQGPDGWEIPLEGLLAAGFTPDAPAPPDQNTDHARLIGEQLRAADQLAREVAELREALAVERAEREREHAARLAAEAVAAERERTIEVQANALRMLTVGRSDAMLSAPGLSQQPSRPRGIVERIAGRFGI